MSSFLNSLKQGIPTRLKDYLGLEEGLDVEKLKSLAIVKENGIEKSALDDREYRALTLENELQAVIIHDPKAVTSSAALSVHAGSYSDPDEVPGLMHFLEHMLFMGTEKYPDENEYQKYLSLNGGWSNAFTADEQTNYFFEVSSDSYEGALDRFSQFFISPLIKTDAVDRELQAVDNENSDRIRKDVIRRYQILQELANPEHPFHKYGVGNIETLKTIPSQKKIDVTGMLWTYYEKLYSANNIKLVLLGRESLDELEELVRKYFTHVPNRHLEPFYKPELAPKLFDESLFSSRINIVPVKDSSNLLCLRWIFGPSTPQNRLIDHLRVLSMMLGDEGEGSIISILREHNLATYLAADIEFSDFSFTSLVVQIQCTEDSIVNEISEILRIVYAYVDLMKTNIEIMEWILQESMAIRYIRFRFKSRERGPMYASSIAGNLQEGYPAEGILSYPYTNRFDTNSLKLVAELLQNLDVENMILDVTCAAARESANRKEKWSGAEYSVEKISEDIVRMCKDVRHSDIPELVLPSRNIYIPRNFDIYSFTQPKLAKAPNSASKLLKASVKNTKMEIPINLDFANITDKRKAVQKDSCVTREVTTAWPEEYDAWRCPTLIQSSESSMLWLKQDTVFKRPKISISCILVTDVANDSPDSSAMTALYIRLLVESMRDKTYHASIAGMWYSISTTENSIYIKYNGYHDRIVEFQKLINSAVMDIGILKEPRFERFKKQTIKESKNWNKGDPMRICASRARYALSSLGWSIHEIIKALEDVTFQNLLDFVPQLYKKLALEMFVYGNSSPQLAMDSFENAKQTFKPSQTFGDLKERYVVKLEPRTQHYLIYPAFDNENASSGIVTIFQCGEYTRRKYAILRIMSSILHEDFFNELRTNQQLGYVVFADIRLTNGPLQMYFAIQSNAADPLYLDERIEEFLESFYQKLQSLKTEDFDSVVNSIISSIMETPKTNESEQSKWNGAIRTKFYDFQEDDIELARAVADVKVNELVELFGDHVRRSAPNRAKLVCGCMGDKHAEEIFGSEYSYEATWESAQPFMEADIREKIKVDESYGHIVCIEDPKLFRENAEYFPSLIDIFERDLE